jgi:hypothetical protein
MKDITMTCPPWTLPALASSELSRREFCTRTALGLLALTLPLGCASRPPKSAAAKSVSYDMMARDLLRAWGDGLVAVQINNPANPAENGALGCPACGFIHGRCLDAVYPLLHLAKVTGDKKYLTAGIAVFEWGKNVSQPDGSWTVIADPKSWKGITVFGAIALAETLKYHGDLLDAATRARWTERLGRAADYVYANFASLDFSNINYGCTAVYGLYLFGEVLGNPDYTRRSAELASGVKKFLTQPNGLLFGEGKPADGKSPRGCAPVDLGYNVEESLVALALYAAASGDADFMKLVTRTMCAHLEFMLPDGAWDNSFGTRHYKWTYWGSRTSDGCQPGFAVLAGANPAFATAVYQNTDLLRRCTSGGLLYGGLHYVSHGMKPCVHHTFTHAKALAAVLDHGNLAQSISAAAPLPRAQADGVKAFPEIATWLAARGPWRATVTAYDSIYKQGVYHPTGGAMSMLWHRDVGPLLAGSLAEYQMVEAYNMQPNPDPGDHPLTPRLELWEGETWFTNLHDLQATVTPSVSAEKTAFEIQTQLLSRTQAHPSAGPVKCGLTYTFNDRGVTFRAYTNQELPETLKLALTLPVVSPTGENVRRISEQRIEIQKPEGIVIIEANVPLRIRETGRERIFNPVPGFEAVPIVAEFYPGQVAAVECRLYLVTV